MTKSKKPVDIDVVKAFQAICGEYSMNKMEVLGDGSWTANLYRGPKKVAVVSGDNTTSPTGMAINWVASCSSTVEEPLLRSWADHAGPLGFFSAHEFVGYIFCKAQLLLRMREAARRGYLVAFDKTEDVDEHELPNDYKASGRKVGPTWLDGYARSYPNMQVVNHQVI